MKLHWSILLLLLIVSSCGGSPPEESSSSSLLKVVCTTGMLGDAVTEMFGDAVEVGVLMGPGVDPHLYKATQGDLGRLTDADIVIYNGLHLEGKMVSVLEKLGRKKTVIAAAELLSEDDLLFLSEEDNILDPHVWFDVKLWSELCRALSDSLLRAYPSQLESATNAAEDYIESLELLDSWSREELAQIPEAQRVLITAHDAYEYFGRAYQVEVRGLQGISTVAEYGLKDVSDLVEFISTRRIPAIFLESSVPKRSMEAVMEGCQRNGFNVKLGAVLYSDALGAADTPEGKYIGMVKYNVQSIKSALMQ